MNFLSRCTRSQIRYTNKFIYLPTRNVTTSFMGRPSPPPLPAEEQREFEELVRKVNQPAAGAGATIEAKFASAQAQSNSQTVDELHPDARRPPPPEFEGDTNPVTGEQGGPKTEPLKHGDWSYGGRITDF